MSHPERAARTNSPWLAALPVSSRLGRLLMLGAGAALLIAALGYGIGHRGLSAEQWASRPLPELEALARSEPRSPGPLLGLGMTMYVQDYDETFPIVPGTVSQSALPTTITANPTTSHASPGTGSSTPT